MAIIKHMLSFFFDSQLIIQSFQGCEITSNNKLHSTLNYCDIHGINLILNKLIIE